MDEIAGILIALIAMFVGLWGIGWAYGDFRKAPKASNPKDTPQPPSA